MWKILQKSKADDFVIGTGEGHSVREFLVEAFSYTGLNYEKYVEIDPRYFRPTEVDALVADPRKGKTELGWEPKVRFKELVKIMVDADFRKSGLEPIGEGDEILEKKFPSRWWRVD
jgi:GDPmannose 4,6-dehydratase